MKQNLDIYIVNDSSKENLGEYSKKIFIYLLNSLDKSTNHIIIESIKKQEENEISNNVIIIEKIILFNIKDFFLNYDDFYEEKTQKFSLFEKLLNI